MTANQNKPSKKYNVEIIIKRKILPKGKSKQQIHRKIVQIQSERVKVEI